MSAPRYDSESRLAKITGGGQGDGTFRLESLRGTERISGLFEHRLVVSSTELELAFSDVAGQELTLTIKNPAGKTRHISGVVTEFSRELETKADEGRELAFYHLTLHPWLWCLGQRSDCRIFHDKDGNNAENKVPDIAKKVIADAGMASSADFAAVTETYPNLVYCVQYNETDLAFINRLFEREGIFYFFEHSEGSHKMIVGDSTSAYEAVDGYAEIVYMAPGTTSAIEHVREWQTVERIRPTKFSHRDHWYKTPTDALEHDSTPSGDTVSQPVADRFLFEYPGRYNVAGDAEHYTKVRLEAARQLHKQASARSNALGLVPGYRFKLDGAPPAAGTDEWVVTDSIVEIDRAEDGRRVGDEVVIDRYSVRFNAILASEAFRPERLTPTPRAQGPHLAKVVGEDNEEITTNELGQVKVCFPWDRKANENKDDSCWIRVKQQWADAGFGSQFIPRHGQEVVVEYIDGDLDRPLVTGCVYHQDNSFPFDPASMKNKSGWKSKSTKEGGADNFHEISFDDTKDEEKLFIQAEKDREVIVKNNDTLTVGVEKNDPGDQTITIKNSRTVTINDADDTLTVETGNRTVTVSSGDETKDITSGSQTVTIGTDQTVDVGSNISITAGSELKLICGSSEITMTPSEITISSPTITVEATGQLNCSSSGTAELSGSSTTVSGDANLTLSGGMCMIN